LHKSPTASKLLENVMDKSGSKVKRSSSSRSSSSSPEGLPRTPSKLAPPISKSPRKSLITGKDFQASEELSVLNRNLIQYIELVKQLEAGHQGGIQNAGKTTINVTIDRSQITVIQEKYQNDLRDLQDKCAENDKTIAGLLVEIYRLESQIKQLNKSNSNKQSQLGDLNLIIGQLEAEVARLKAKLTFYQNQKAIFELQLKELQKEVTSLNNRLGKVITDFNEKKLTNAGLATQYYKIEKQLRFQIGVLSRELVAERTKTNIDWEEIKTKKGERYKIWMEEELKVLQATYQTQMEEVQLTMENLYEEKERNLVASLATAHETAGKPNEEASKLKVELESMKLKLGELEANNQQLGVKHLEISTELELKRESYRTQLSAKDRELARMRRDHEAIKAKYEELLRGSNRDQVEIYSTTLTPEIRRISNRFGSQQLVSSGKTLNFSRKSTSGSIISSSSSGIMNGANGAIGVKEVLEHKK